MAASSRSPTRYALSLLRRMMNNEVLAVPQLVAEGPFGDDAVRRHLIALEEEIPGVISDGAWGRRWSYRATDAEDSDGFGLLSLMLASTLLSSLRGSELDRRLQEHVVRERNRTESSAPAANDLSRMFFAKSRMVNPLGVAPDRLDRLAKALYEARRVVAYYERFSGKTFQVEVEPYTLILSDDGVYIYGRCVQSTDTTQIDECFLYNVERIRSLELSRERFLYPHRDEYDPHELFRHCFGIFLPNGTDPEEVELSFTSRWASFLRLHKWHPSQSPISQDENGRVTVRFQLHVTHDLARWIRGLGRDVEVVGPARLQTWVETGEDPANKSGG